MFFASRARLASWHPPMQRRRNLENSAVPTLLARGSRLAFRATMCRAEGDLEACWNRILTIFDPYTFSHSQGQSRRIPFVCYRGGAVVGREALRKRLAIQRTMTPEASKAAGRKIACMAICRTCACTMRLYLVAASAFALANTSGGTVVWELRGTIITIRN